MNAATVATTYTRRWYAAQVVDYVWLANSLLDGTYIGPDENGLIEPVEMTDTALADDLGEHLNGMYSFMEVGDDDEREQMAAMMLTYSDHRGIAPGREGCSVEYFAQHAFIADVMVKLGRAPGPYLG